MRERRIFFTVIVVCLGIVLLNIVRFDKVNASSRVSDKNKLDKECKELLKKGYTEEELAFAEISEDIIELKEDNIEDEQIINIIDERSKNANQSVTRGNPLDKIENAYETWERLTDVEKKLVTLNPTKSVAAFAASKKSVELTAQNFGKNGLGDKSDGFRHATWCALMARDAGSKFAKDFSTAHESGKTEEMLQQVASDGYKEKDHMEMDLHNNGVGISLIKDKNVSNDEVVSMVMNKLTNNKATGIYWLHD